MQNAARSASPITGENTPAHLFPSGGKSVRRIVEPPPSSQCDRCGGQLKLHRIDTASSVPGLNRQIFACAKCGNERLFVAQQDLYTSRSASEQRMIRV
jgi:hypothetical protein